MNHGLFACALLLLAALPLRFAAAGDRVTGRMFATRSEVIAREGMAATSHPLATQIALDILKRGGTAVDAAIAANAALGLMEPVGNGIGGDLFAIVWDGKTKKLYGLNACGRSPRGLTLDHFREQGLTEVPMIGPLPVTVPGTVDGWFALHGRFGKLPMSDVLAPAVRYAREGFPVTELIAHYWALGGARLKDQPNFAATYLPGGHAPNKGEIFRNPDLASTLEKIGAGGRDIYYKGEIAQTIDAFCRRVSCFLRAEDLAAHESEWIDPVSTNYRGFDVWELPPPGQGIAVLQWLNLLEPYDLRTMGHNSTEYLHLMIEMKKIVYEDRAHLYADPPSMTVPVPALISKEYAAQRAKLFNPQEAARQVEPGNPRHEDGDTIYLTVADSEGTMISLIQSNYGGMGCGLVPDGLGFCFQNRGALFDLTEGRPNSYAPGKRPFHTIIPAFITKDGKPYISFGVMGGDMQPQGHVQVVCNLIDFGMNLQEAGDAARFRHWNSSEPTGTRIKNGGTVALESGISAQVRRELQSRGHRLGEDIGAFGGYQAIMWDEKNGVYVGASESRKDGHAAGY